MRRFVRRCYLFMQLSSREQVWFAVLFVGSGIVRAALLTLPLRRLAPSLGAHDQDVLCTVRVIQEQQLQAWRIGRITALASKYTPWQSTCLVQALVAQWVLAYYRIPSVLYVGVTRSTQPGNGLLAHAWLRVGQWIITGREGHQAFTVVATLPCHRGAQEATCVRHMAGRRWQQIKVRILQRQVPHTVMSWRFLLPRQPLAVRLHRRVFCGAWPTLPRWVWGMIVLYASSRWFTYQCWRQIWHALRTHSQTTWERFQIPVRTPCLDLVRLAVLHSIPPHFYYHYGLFRQPRHHWLQYIYTHELPHWHAVMSPCLSPHTRHVLTDKHAFAAIMARHGIPTVPMG